MIKYFYESKKRNLYYESDDKYEVAMWILSEACFQAEEPCTLTEIELHNEILEIIIEKYVNEWEEE
jgi:hypothetical protein